MATGGLTKDTNGIWVAVGKEKISYPADGNANSFSVEESSFWFKHRNNVIRSVMLRFPFSENYADVGAGNGLQAKLVAENFPQTEVFVIEPGYEGCLNARKRKLPNVYNITFQDFDFDTHRVSAAGIYDVLEHIEKDDEFLKQLKQKMPKGSLIYTTVPAHNYLWSDVDDYAGHFRRYDSKMIQDVVLRTGLNLVYFSYFFSYIPPLTYFLRSLPYKFKGDRGKENILEAETEQHNPSRTVRSVFNMFHSRELRKLKTSNVGFGASCIAVFKT